MTNEEILRKLHQIGFTGFEHLRKEERDGRERLTWTIPLKGEKEWFTARLIKGSDEILIEMLINPFGKSFQSTEIELLIDYIESVILKHPRY